MILLSFSNWNAWVFVPVDPTISPSIVYVKPAKSTVSPLTANLPCGTWIPFPEQSLNSVIVAPSAADANASSSVSYFTVPICATYGIATSVWTPPSASLHRYPSGAACSNAAAFSTVAASGATAIAAAAVASTTMSPFSVPPSSISPKPSFASLPDAEISTSPLITLVPVTVTCTDG